MQTLRLAPLFALALSTSIGAGCVTRTVYVVDDRDDAPARGGSGPVAQADPAPEDEAGIRDVDQFYEPLSPYGSWVAYPGYGMVFVPSAHVVGAGYRPYTHGHWEYTEWGWTWADHHPFGWATGHYGRWFFDNSYGWVWVPGTTWSPAWVTWRTGGAYVGWAAMPPGAYYGAHYSVYETSWVYVYSYNVGSPYVSSVLIVGPGYAVCYRETYPVYTTTVVHGRTYYRGPDYDRVTRDGAHVVHRPVRETERERAVTRPPSGTTIARGRDRERTSDRDGTSGSRRTRDGRDDGSDGRGGGRDGGRDGSRDDGGGSSRDESHSGGRDGDRGHGNDPGRNDGDNPARNPRDDNDRGDSRGNDGRGNDGRSDDAGRGRDKNDRNPSDPRDVGRGRDRADGTPASMAPEQDGVGVTGPRPIEPIDDGSGRPTDPGTGRPGIVPERGHDLPDFDRSRDPHVDVERPDTREQPPPEKLRPIREPYPRDRLRDTGSREPAFERSPSRTPSGPSPGYSRTPSRQPSGPSGGPSSYGRTPSRPPSQPSVGVPSSDQDQPQPSTPTKKRSKTDPKKKSDGKKPTKSR